ncbi:MAG TPA: ABC transporter ATP-binding protein [Sedimentisphaerales bacterium]|nr:ABC transporter ATP-binding protein [Sedimentisphaerales bacterium]
MDVVSIEKLSKIYQLGAVGVHALRDVDFAIEEGQYIAIMGPSGSGKSTLLNLLGCLDRPTSGRYLLHDTDVSKLNDGELSAIRGRQIGFIFQSYNLIDQLNVAENIELPMFYQGLSQHRSAQRAMELAELVGLGDRLRHRPFQLSGGQQQRVAIARALANDPVIVLGDEPTGNLDSASGAEILQILERLHQAGKTIIVVTHDTAIAAKAQRVIHLLDGRIERDINN